MADNLSAACRLFIMEQSGGEWGDKIEREDAAKLEAFVREQIALTHTSAPASESHS